MSYFESKDATGETVRGVGSGPHDLGGSRGGHGGERRRLNGPVSAPPNHAKYFKEGECQGIGLAATRGHIRNSLPKAAIIENGRGVFEAVLSFQRKEEKARASRNGGSARNGPQDCKKKKTQKKRESYRVLFCWGVEWTGGRFGRLRKVWKQKRDLGEGEGLKVRSKTFYRGKRQETLDQLGRTGFERMEEECIRVIELMD